MKLKDYIRAEIQTRPNESMIRLIAKILFIPGFNAVYLIRKAQLSHTTLFKWYYRHKLALRYGIYLGYNTEIGPGLVIGHPTSIVIGEGVVIGKRCTIYQQTTIGVKTTGLHAYPMIGDDVTIYAGAKIIGAVEIGDNTDIGASAVVTKKCPGNCVMKGVPATWTKKEFYT